MHSCMWKLCQYLEIDDQETTNNSGRYIDRGYNSDIVYMPITLRYNE